MAKVTISNGNVMMFLKIIGTALVIGGLLVAITQSHTSLSKDVEGNIKTMESVCAENDREHGEYEEGITDIDKVCDKLNIDITELKADVKYLREDTKQILDEIKALK